MAYKANLCRSAGWIFFLTTESETNFDSRKRYEYNVGQKELDGWQFFLEALRIHTATCDERPLQLIVYSLKILMRLKQKLAWKVRYLEANKIQDFCWVCNSHEFCY